MLKLLFILFSFIINFLLYCAPAYATHWFFSRQNNNRLILSELEHKSSLLLVFIPFFVWFVLFLFDPTQKTVQQLIFLDPLITGIIIAIALLLMTRISPPQKKKVIALSFTIIASLTSIGGFFYFNTSL